MQVADTSSEYMAEASATGARPIRNWLALLSAAVIAPNLLMVAIAHYLHVDRQLVDLDYLLVAAIAPMLPTSVVAVLLSAAAFADAFVVGAPLSNFALGDAFGALSALLQLPKLAVVAAVVAVLVGIGVAVGLLLPSIRPRPGERGLRWPLIALTAILFAADLLNGSNVWSPTARATIPVNIATSAGFKSLRAIYRDHEGGGVFDSGLPIADSSLATGALRRDLASRQGIGARNVMLVVVESEGLFSDPQENKAVLADYFTPRIRARYDVRMGDIPFHGSTTNAEFRELCAAMLSYRHASKVNGPSCLPAILHRRGFETTAIHGYHATFFDRGVWYPKIGFDSLLFDTDLESLQGANRRECGGVYRGVCDADAARVAESRLRESSATRQFVYWLTLNSHVPFDVATVRADAFPCTSKAEQGDHDICDLTRLLRRVHRAVASIASDSEIAPTRFIIVGDHTTPFTSPARRSLFVPGRVPFIELTPRTPD